VFVRAKLHLGWTAVHHHAAQIDLGHGTQANDEEQLSGCGLALAHVVVFHHFTHHKTRHADGGVAVSGQGVNDVEHPQMIGKLI
jgi:hypothetical protein